MEDLFLNNNWALMTMFHKSNIDKVKRQTGAYHVIHIKDHITKNKQKVNCLLMRGKKGECKYGGVKNFISWTKEDYQEAINTYNNEFKAN